MKPRTSVNWNRSFLLVFTLATLLLSARPLHAQVDAGSILGTVTDQSGSVINGATVTLTNEGTGASLTTTTSAEGGYKFDPVRIGTYKLDITYTGFEAVTAKGIVVNIGAAVVQNFTLKPGNVSQSIEVTAEAPLIQSQNASVGQVVDTQTVNNLPLNGRNFTFLAQISAGVNTPQADTRGNASSGAFSANGLRPAQNNYLLDGIDNNSDTVDFLNGTNFVVLPPVDAVQEFKVETSNFSAQFGRSGAAVLNATIKSGTNQIHGSAWEFFRNDVLDAADWFENAGGVKKGELRQNQFGGTLGGPVVIPHVINGHNKLFFFVDYQGLRRVQGTIFTSSVPTTAERSSGYTDFTDLITGQSGTVGDALGRRFPFGTVFDPATTRQIAGGQYVRDPIGAFGTPACPSTTMDFTGLVAACQLNHIPAGRLDPNAIKLLNLYPNPTNGSLFSNYANSPKLTENSNSFDVRMDANFTEKDLAFFRFSWVDDPQFIPGPFGGVADGGAFQQGNQTANAQQTAIGYTHTFSPVMINEARAGFNYLKTTRSGPVANELGIPAQYGIQGVPQIPLNGGLPQFSINGLTSLGSNGFLPSAEVSSTLQVSDDVTRIFSKHTFKMGFEYQHVKFSTLQPPYSHGQYVYDGRFTDIPSGTPGNTGRVGLLLTPTVSSVPGGVDYVGGANQTQLSNIFESDNGKNYWGIYANDDWKITTKLTINLGLRYDFFGLVYDHHAGQANFVPSGAPLGRPLEIIPVGNPLATQLSPSYLSLLQQDGIGLAYTNIYGKGLGNSEFPNFAPRVGFAYQVNPKLVVRGGFGLFYNGFENRGYYPNLGESYPFQFNFNYTVGSSTVNPYTFPGCSTAGPGFTATFETGFSCTPLNPAIVNATGLAFRGIQFNYLTPYSMGINLTVQYQITPTIAVQAAYVSSQGRHLEVFPNYNLPSVVAPQNTPEGTLVPFPDFGFGFPYAATEGNSGYNSLQTKAEKRFANGLQFLFTYTWSKTLSDAVDLLNGGSTSNVFGYRAPYVPGMGIHADYGLANYDLRNVFHFSGTYDLPFGKGRHFANGASGFKNQVIGGWSVNWSATFQGGQPINITCPSGTASGLNCGALRVAGQPLKLGLHTDKNGLLSWYGNPAAFTQPCVLGPGGVPEANIPTGCVPLTGNAALGAVTQVPGPGFNRVDFSIFKNFAIKERATLQFRTEFFNIANHPTFNAPNFGGNGVVAIGGSGNYNSSTFGEIGSTRLAPYDPRQIQFALKLLF